MSFLSGLLSAKQRWKGPVGQAIRGEGVHKPQDDYKKVAPVFGRADQMRHPRLARLAYLGSGKDVGLGLFSLPVGTPTDHLLKSGQATPLPGSTEERATILRQMLASLVSADSLDPRVEQKLPPQARQRPPQSLLQILSDFQHGFSSGGSVHKDQARLSLYGAPKEDYLLRAQQQTSDRILGEQRLQNAMSALRGDRVGVNIQG